MMMRMMENLLPFVADDSRKEVGALSEHFVLF
jgi:hypothetical protein